jgi:glucokinase
MILAGDVGGTKTLLGLFDFAPGRPTPVTARSFATAEFDGLPSIVSTFLESSDHAPRIEAACFGVAGPVVDQAAALTNVPWNVRADELARALDGARVRLLNDLEAMAYAVPVLKAGELHTLQQGRPRKDGNAVLIASGTGLGESILHRVGARFVPVASEGGHADFAPRNTREIALVQMLLAEGGRVDIERVVSGPGIANLFRFAHADEACAASVSRDEPDPAAVSEAAMGDRCPRCVEAMEMFVEAYGSAAANLALQAVATAGVYLGGGIAPKVLPLLEQGGFLAAFARKPPMEPLLEAMPVHVILNKQAALVGAAVYANDMV